IRIGQHLLGILKDLGPLPEKPLRILGSALAIHRPQVAYAAQIEIWVRFCGHLQHLPMARRPVPAADLADLDPVIRTQYPRVRSSSSSLAGSATASRAPRPISARPARTSSDRFTSARAGVRTAGQECGGQTDRQPQVAALRGQLDWPIGFPTPGEAVGLSGS